MMLSMFWLMSGVDYKSNSNLGEFIGFFTGLVIIFLGLRRYREYRLASDIPDLAIRSLAMGIVRTRGKASAAQPVQSPLSATPCCCFRVDIEYWKRGEHGDNDATWATDICDIGGGPVYLEDSGAKVLVDVQRARWDMPRSRRVEVNLALNRKDPEVQRLGEYVEAARAKNESLTMQALARPFLGKDPAKQKKYGLAFAIASSVAGGWFSDAKDSFAGKLIADALPSDPVTGGFASERVSKYRLTEYCILPGQEYGVAGTCAENPQPSGIGDRNLITRGKDESTLVISTKTDARMDRSMFWAAFGKTLFGAVLSGVCLAMLLWQFKR